MDAETAAQTATAPPRRASSADRLLAAASALMIERRSTEVSLGDIAKRSGVNSALIKYHFGSKAGLLMALLRRDASLAVRQVQALARAKMGPVDKVRLHVAGTVNTYYRTPYLNRLIHDLLHSGSPEMAREVSDFFVVPLVEFHRALLAEGAAAGVFRTVDPMIFYFTLFGAIDHLFHGRNTLLYCFGIADITDAMREELIALVTEMVLGAIRLTPDDGSTDRQS